MAVEARQQGHDPHSKRWRKMDGVICGISVSRGPLGPLGLCRSSLEKEEGKGTLFGGGE